MTNTVIKSFQSNLNATFVLTENVQPALSCDNMYFNNYFTILSFHLSLDGCESWPQSLSWKQYCSLWNYFLTSLCSWFIYWAGPQQDAMKCKAMWSCTFPPAHTTIQIYTRQSFIEGRTPFVCTGSSELLANWECIKYGLSWRECKPQNASPEGRIASKQGSKTKTRQPAETQKSWTSVLLNWLWCCARCDTICDMFTLIY